MIDYETVYKETIEWLNEMINHYRELNSVGFEIRKIEYENMKRKMEELKQINTK